MSSSGDGKTPNNPTSQFGAARDGIAGEPPRDTTTEAQRRSAEKVAAVQNENEATKRSAESALEFNVQVEDKPRKESYAHKNDPQSHEQYTSKLTGQTYETGAAIQAAKNRDNAELKRQSELESKDKNHVAPALTMGGAPPDKYRGRSGNAPIETQNKDEQNKLSSKAQELKDAAIKQKADQDKSAEQAKSAEESKQLSNKAEELRQEANKQSQQQDQSKDSDMER